MHHPINLTRSRFRILAAAAMVAASALGTTAAANASSVGADSGPAGSRSVASSWTGPPAVVWNDNRITGVSIGLYHYKDGSYGAFDGYLTPNNYSNRTPLGWSSVAGIYIGPGFCAQSWYHNDFEWEDYPYWRRKGRDLPPGRHFPTEAERMRIVPYPAPPGSPCLQP